MRKLLGNTFFIICAVISSQAVIADSLENSLKEICLEAFDVLSKNDSDEFLKMLPPKTMTDKEKDMIRSYVDKRHSRYMVRDKGWSELTYRSTKFKPAQQKYIDEYNATQMAWSRFKMVHKNEKKTKRTAQCTFIEVNKEWFLVKLP